MSSLLTVTMAAGPWVAAAYGLELVQQSAQDGRIPRMADGRPDLQSVWSFSTATPLERPDDLAGLEFLNEMIHSSLIVPLDGRPQQSSAVPLWAGDSRGRWEGDTLVVVTTNFRPEGTGQVVLGGASSQPVRRTGAGPRGRCRVVR